MSVDAATSLGLVGLLLAILASGLWVPFALIALALISMGALTTTPVGEVLATSMWSASTEWALAALPMFIWMGEILYRSRFSQDLFSGLAPWMGLLPGRLIHVNIVGSGIFAAVSGSSAATCATIGKMSLPELERRGYDRDMAIGSLAGSATLGFLIPPSIIFIIYGVAVEESIARLFLAGVFPGLMMMALFMGYVALWSIARPAGAPAAAEARAPLKERLAATRRLAPVLALIAGVIGSIYTGLASPTDAAAVGVALALFITWRMGDLTRKSFTDGLMAATRTSCMIGFILAGAAVLTAAMGYVGAPRELALWIGALDLNPLALIFALTLFFLLLGCFLDGISIVVLTAAVIVPMVREAGIDLIWFGVYLVLVVEMSQITPPVGFNLFVLQNLTGRDILRIARASAPFFSLLVLGIVLLTAFPEIATWLPTQMTAR